MNKFLFFVLGVSVVTLGCNSGNERLEERAAVEGKAAGQATIELENANLAARVDAMEKDLDDRHLFLESIEGNYVGTMGMESQDKFDIAVTFSQSFPRYAGSKRVRTLEELSYEINNLYLVAQVVEWPTNEGSPLLTQAYGCIFSGIRPDFLNGKIFLASEDCKKSYSFYLAEENDTELALKNRPELKVENSRVLASRILNRSRNSVPRLIGSKRTNLSRKASQINLKKVTPGTER